jgi:hypothetical protein
MKYFICFLAVVLVAVAVHSQDMFFNIIIMQRIQACGGCGIWFDWQDAQANKPKLVVEYTTGGGSQSKTYQHGLNGMDNAWGTFIDANAANNGPDNLHSMLIKSSPKRNGLFKCDISDIPVNATITKATLYLHIHTHEGLAGADNSSVLWVHQCAQQDWDWQYVNWTNYAQGKAWNTIGGDFGVKIRELRAKEDMKDRGFSKSNPDCNFDFTDYVKGLQQDRLSTGLNFIPSSESDMCLNVFPNPVSGNTILSYTLPFTGRTNIGIYGSNGALLRSIVERPMQKGSYQIHLNSSEIGAGVYFLKLSSMNASLVKRIVIY